MHAAALSYLDAVARHGSIRKAADELGIASSGVNRAILHLEAEIGARLFDRSPRGVALTPAGERLVRHARDTLAEFQFVRAEVASLGGVVGGEVRVAAIPSLISRLMPEVLRLTAERYPLVTFRVAEANPTQITTDVQAGRFDIGLVLVDRPHRDIAIVYQTPAPVGAVMRADHPLAKRKSLTLSDCSGHDVVLLDDMWVLGPSLQYERSSLGTHMNVRLTSNSFELNSRMIRAGYGIGIFTAVAFLDDIAPKRDGPHPPC